MIRLAVLLLLGAALAGMTEGVTWRGHQKVGSYSSSYASHGRTPKDASGDDYLPTPQPGLSRELAPGERIRSLTLEQWRAVNSAGLDDAGTYWLARTGWCEGHLDPTSRNGVHLGAWQVNPEYHGPVPGTLEAQARQAAAIAVKHGTQPWDARDGCAEWDQ